MHRKGEKRQRKQREQQFAKLQKRFPGEDLFRLQEHSWSLNGPFATVVILTTLGNLED